MKAPIHFPSGAVVAAISIIAANIFLPTFPSAAILPFQQYDTASDIPSSAFEKNAVLYGRVERVLDGDTIRIRHYPLFPIQQSSSFIDRSKKNLADHTISVRLYGIDAPELGKYGNPSMPFADEARKYTQSLVDEKIVKVKMLRRDRYARVIGRVTVSIPWISTRDVSMELARNGFASLYTGAGAEYDDNFEALERAISDAQRKKLGIWSKGIERMINPSDYKRAIRNGEAL